jgi:hypothetical protein
MITLNTIRSAVSNPRKAVNNFYQQQRLVSYGIGTIQGQIATLEQSIAAIEEGIKLRETPAFQWHLKKYLPARRAQKLEARCDIPPDDSIKQAMAQGQINEIDGQIEEISELQSQLNTLRERLDIARQAEAKWFKSKGQRPEKE